LKQYHELEHWLSWVDELSRRDYVIIDQFLDQDLYTEIRSFFLLRLPSFSQAGIGALELNTVEKEIRGDHTHWLDRKRDIALGSFWELVDETIGIFNRYCYLSLSGYEFHFANYPPGGHYDKHLDQFQNRNNRMISVILYLNEQWQKGDGGELEIFEKDGRSLLIEPVAGRCVMFKSAEVPHAVMESCRNRYSLTGWLLYQPSTLGQFLG
jgi:SM-20-related protein